MWKLPREIYFTRQLLRFYLFFLSCPMFSVDQRFLVLIIQGNRKIDFKKLKQYFETSKIRMATPEEIMQMTGASVGSVSMINEGLNTLIDQKVAQLDYCYGGCGIDKMTLRIKSNHLIHLTRAELGDFTTDRLA